MNTAAELQQAYADYQRTRFGGWPWEEDAVAFPRTEGRFATIKSATTGELVRSVPPAARAKEEELRR